MGYVGASARCENEAGGLFQHPDLIAYLEHQIQTETHKEYVCHPCADKRRQDPPTAQSDRNRVRRPIAESDRQRLPYAHGHAAPSGPASSQTQRNPDQNHDDRDEGERDSTVVICRQPRRLGSMLLSPPGVGSDIMERHQFRVAGEPRGEVIGNEG